MKLFRKNEKDGGKCRPPNDKATHAFPPLPFPARTEVPNLELISNSGKLASLSDCSDQPVILAFYPTDWSPVCGYQIALYNELLPLFEEYKA